MQEFRHLAPTAIEFGVGKLDQLGELTAPYGSQAMLVTVPWEEPLTKRFERAQGSLEAAGLSVLVYAEAQPNPTVDLVDRGAELAQSEGIEVVVGMGGGSSIDVAKGIAVAATHPGSVWDYMYFQETQPTFATLPIVAVTTSSGTGSHATRYAVITKSDEECKSALAHDRVFPQVSVVDPQLMLSLPPATTAFTSFDAFTHAFESYTNPGATPISELLALESLRLIAENAQRVVDDGADLEARSRMAWADTLAGICISNAGTTLPHAMGQPISGHFPHAAHGQSLAVVYPTFLEFTCEAAADKFTRVGQLFEASVSDCHQAVETMLDWMGFLGVRITLSALDIKEEDLGPLLRHCMEFPDVEAAPRVPTEAEVLEMYKQML